MTDVRIVLLVLDSVGIGANPDAERFGDVGANTLGNTALAVGGLCLPTLGSLGLGNIGPIEGVAPATRPRAAFGRAAARGAGKDTTTGHWEISGVIVEEPLSTFANGFPEQIIDALERVTERRVIGNCAESGTRIIAQLGSDHVHSGDLIVYTSADSVLQIAAHEDIVPIEDLYRYCGLARAIADEHGIGRVIARPFVGSSETGFTRTSRRRDFSLPPPGRTILDALSDSGREVVAIGKVDDIFANRGITEAHHTRDNTEGLARTIESLEQLEDGLVFSNLVDFDVLYGHRRDPLGYARCLEALDAGLEPLLARLRGGRDLLIITADHGNDPTMPGTDHTREHVPILAFGPTLSGGLSLGTRASFADIGATIAEAFGVEMEIRGRSFWQELT